jgi:hypothetical protein
MGLSLPAVPGRLAVRGNDPSGAQKSAGAMNMRERLSLSETAQPGRHDEGRTTLASLAAIGGVLAASSCCLPVLPFMMAAGLAGGSAFLSAARPYLLAASVVSVAYGFYQARRAKKCRRRPGVLSSVLLWLSAGFVFLSIFFPQVMANAAAGLLAR